MKNIKTIIMLFLITILTLKWNNSINADDSKTLAVIQTVSGNVTVVRKSSKLRAKRLMRLNAEDEIITDKSSTLQLMFKNAVSIRLHENTRIKINPLTGEDYNKYSITQFTGSIKSSVKKLTGGATYDITTPATVAGVRGTEFSTIISVDGTTAVVVEDGSVNVAKVKQKDDVENQDQQTINVKKGYKAEVGAEQDKIQVSEERDPRNFRRRFIQRRLLRFKRNYKRILRRIKRRVRFLIARFKRGRRILRRMNSRVRRFDPTVRRIMSSGNRFAIRRIGRKVRFFRRRAFRIIYRMRRMRRRLIALNYISENIERNLEGHESVKSAEFKDFRNHIRTNVRKMSRTFPQVRQEMRVSARIIRRWRKLARKSIRNQGNNRFRGRFRQRRFRRRRFFRGRD